MELYIPKNDEDLIKMIESINNDIKQIINTSPCNIEKNKDILELFKTNLKYYKLAKQRKLDAPNKDFMRKIATIIGFETNERALSEKKLTKKR